MTLRFKFIFSGLLMALCLIIIMQSFWQQRALQSGEYIIEDSAVSFVDATAFNLTPLLMQRDYAAIFDNLQFLQHRNPSWRYVLLKDANDRRIYPMSEPLPPDAELFLVSSRIAYLGDSVGVLHVGIDLQSDVSLIKELVDSTKLVMIGFIAVTLFVVVFVLNKVVVEPLRDVGGAMQAVARQDYDAPLPRLRSDEIGELIEGFSLMRDRLRERDKKLVGARIEAERANKSKGDFLTSMSHELRTPLNAIMGFAQLLQLEDSLPENVRGWPDEIMSASNHLLEMISQILDLSAIDNGKLHVDFAPFELGPLIDEVEALIKPMVAVSGVSFTVMSEVDHALIINSDQLRVKQILLNLLSNACKYAGNDADIVLYTRRQGDSLLLGVSDNGVGIAKRKHHLLFNSFERLGAERTGQAGSGIGLLFSSELAKLLQGELNFVSEENRGSNFWLQLPINGPTSASS